jgi:hypothetical protein
MQIIYKYIVCILLFTCLGFTQDTLRTKQGKQYIGKVIDSDSKSVEFSYPGWDSPKRFYLNSAEVLLEPKIVKRHQILKAYKNYKNNKKKLKKEKKIYLMDARRNLSISEKSFIDEKAVYNAKLVPMKKWYYYFPAIGTLFIGSLILDEVLIYATGIPEFFPLTICSGLYFPYNIHKNFYLENKNEINYPESILTKSEKILYKHSYNKTLKKRKIKNTLIGASPFIIAVGAGAVYLMNSWGSGSYNSGIGYWP